MTSIAPSSPYSPSIQCDDSTSPWESNPFHAALHYVTYVYLYVHLFSTAIVCCLRDKHCFFTMCSLYTDAPCFPCSRGDKQQPENSNRVNCGFCVSFFNLTLIACWIVLIHTDSQDMICPRFAYTFVLNYSAFFWFILFQGFRYVARLTACITLCMKDPDFWDLSLTETLQVLNPIAAAPARTAYGSNERSVDLPLVSIPPLVEIGV